MKWNNARAELVKDEAVAEELAKNESEYQMLRELIRARVDKNLTQEQLAELVGTKQTNISRLESGRYNPSLKMLKKVAEAVGKKLEIHLV
jgi:DNA-binding XRE family transcriptional regulator